ncbi:MAG: hypothetical protein RL441_534 [Actinomycetota bacterium]
MIFLHDASAGAAAETPEGRDRVIDGVRAFAIVGVVFGHLLMGLVYWKDGVPYLGNLLASSIQLQLLTWLLQVMPFFFIAGGAANLLSWQSASAKEMPYHIWVWNRVRRLMKPIIIYMAVMAPVGAIVYKLVMPSVATPLLLLTTQLLWFVGIYTLITAMTPLLIRMEAKLHFAAAAFWFALVTMIDLGRLSWGWPGGLGLINFIGVWAIASHCGFWYIQRQANRAQVTALGLLLLALNIVIVRLGPYPVSLVGLPGEEFSNMAPPSLVMAIHTLIAFCALTALRPAIARFLDVPRIWRRVVEINIAAMTIYLWHLPMIVLVTLLFHTIGWDRPSIRTAEGVVLPSDGFLLASIPYWVLAAWAIFWLVQVLWFTEQMRLPWWDKRVEKSSGSWLNELLAICGVSATGVSLILLAGSGLAGFPNRVTELSGFRWTSGQAVIVLAIGIAAIRTAVAIGPKTEPKN